MLMKTSLGEHCLKRMLSKENSVFKTEQFRKVLSRENAFCRRALSVGEHCLQENNYCPRRTPLLRDLQL